MISRLNRLIVANVRNLAAIELDLAANFNVFVGANGSGKTSLLEAVHLLGLGRSFRARSAQQLITFGANSCLVRGLQTNVWLAVEKNVNGGSSYKVGEKAEKSAAELTRALPIQLIDINSHLLVEGGPENRRKFIDWGVFHMEHEFLQHWRSMQRALDQRNAALKQRNAPEPAWDEAFVRYAELVDSARRQYLERFIEVFMPMVDEFLGINAEFIYASGWDREYGLHNHLFDNRALDLMCGFTNCGPHRAELMILIDDQPAKQVLSRGQIKIFASIMLLARAKLLPNPQAGLFLIDDLHAELDQGNSRALVAAIHELGCQTFLTGIEADLLKKCLQDYPSRQFHVEQGSVVAV